MARSWDDRKFYETRHSPPGGRPHIDRTHGDTCNFRSRKSWAVLAYLILSEQLPTRSQLASLLFTEAGDPLRAPRWSLSEIRRCLGDDGDLLVLQLASDAMVDVEVVAHGSWVDSAGVCVPGLGADLHEPVDRPRPVHHAGDRGGPCPFHPRQDPPFATPAFPSPPLAARSAGPAGVM